MRSRSLFAFAAGVAALSVPVTPRGQGADDQTPAHRCRRVPQSPSRGHEAIDGAEANLHARRCEVEGQGGGTSLDLGMTLWRLRPSAPSEDAARLLVQDATSSELTAERIDTGTTLAIGDRVRLTLNHQAPVFST